MPKINKIKQSRINNARKMLAVLSARKTQSEVPEKHKNSDVVTLAVTKKLPNDEDDFATCETSMSLDQNMVASEAEVRTDQIELPNEEEDLANCGSAMSQDQNMPVSESQNDRTEEMDLEIENQTSTGKKSLIIGRRIIDVQHFFQKLKQIENHGPLGCDLSCLEIVSERRIGLRSQFNVECTLCHQHFFLENEPPDDLDINRRTVAGTIAIGCGQSQLEEILSSMDLPTITPHIYQKCHAQLSTYWQKMAVDTMNKAAEEERNYAMEEGRVDKNGVPIIDVILDGCWSKRTYKKNYSALSGAAAIIGKKTGHVLYLGVKNKYCCVCAQAEKRCVEPKKHLCYKNYTGSSTGMESEILIEGFKCSIEMHNLIYGRMVSDGDSSTYNKLLQCRPYPHLTIEKIECRNHIMRNLCNKLENLRVDTKYPLRHRKYIHQKKIMLLRKTIRTIITKHKQDSSVEQLFNDLMLAHVHAFEDHSRCKTYFCDKKSSDILPDNDFFTSTTWNRIATIMSNVASHAPSLIHDVDSNVVERYNSIVAKLVGGKRVNFSLKGSYETRCHAAVVSFNSHKVLSSVYKKAVGKSPKGSIAILEKRRLKKMQLSQKYQRKKRRLKFSTTRQDADYGEQCKRPDMAPEMLETSKNSFLQNLKKTHDERARIEKATILQSGSSEWLEVRRNLLTASNFGKVFKRRKDVSCANMVKNLLYKKCLEHVASLKHGRNNEKTAIEQLARQENLNIKPCGLFIDEEIPYLGASPDGIVDCDTIVEIKCPITAYKLGFTEAVNKKKIPFLKKNGDGTLKVNTNHDWYYQIQGQIHITKAKKCIFGLWHGEKSQMVVEIIERDNRCWDKMLPKLKEFYLDCILPELVDPRNTRSMPLRDPEYIKQAITERQNKKVAKQNLPSTSH